MDPFSVWLRPMGTATKVRVEGEENAQWLRERILDEGAGCGEVKAVSGTPFGVFLAYHTRDVDEFKLLGLMKELAEVQLRLEPA